ncbi:MAG: carboxylating nicotinate-nucleotide diphosphorylase [Candidatus Zixiibacteriota bacterium]
MDAYHQQMLDLVRAALNEDIGPGDITSLACLEPARIKAEIISKSDGVLSGVEPVRLAFHLVDSANRVNFIKRDSDRFRRGERIAEIEGYNQTIMTSERVALNFLAHLSGIATHTARFVEKLNGTTCRLLDTRKTTPGQRLLEKRAVLHGGGSNHRIGLYDMVLIKDNHIAAAGSITEAVRLTREYLGSVDCREQFGAVGPIEIEVEVTNEKELEQAIAAGVDRLLFDNQSSEALAELVAKARSIKPAVKLEASGNVTLDNVAVVAATGVDFISTGAITHSAPAVDFSLLVVNRLP